MPRPSKAREQPEVGDLDVAAVLGLELVVAGHLAVEAREPGLDRLGVGPPPLGGSPAWSVHDQSVPTSR